MELVWEIIGAVLDRQLGTAALASLAAVILVTVLIKNRATVGPNFEAALSFIKKYRAPIVGVGVALSLTFAGAVAYGRHAGLLRFITIEGKLEPTGQVISNDTRIIAFVGDNLEVSDASVKANASGYFAFPDCFRRPYHFFAFSINEPNGQISFGEFDRDLRANDDDIRSYPFPQQTRNLRRLATLNFDTAQSALDSKARQQIFKLLNQAAATPDIDFVLWLGFADERGTEDANFILALRRAIEVQGSSGLASVQSAGIRHIVASFGETWPAVAEVGAKAWAENRRVEVYAVLRSTSTTAE